ADGSLQLIDPPAWGLVRPAGTARRLGIAPTDQAVSLVGKRRNPPGSTPRPGERRELSPQRRRRPRAPARAGQRWSFAGFGGDSGRVEDGDLSSGEADQAAVGELAQDLGGGLAGGADQRGELFVGQRHLRVSGSHAEAALLAGEGGQGGGDALGHA